MNQSKIFFDTNVLVYAHDRASIYHTESASLLKLAFSNQIKSDRQKDLDSQSNSLSYATAIATSSDYSHL
jgi:hypothetical protein